MKRLLIIGGIALAVFILAARMPDDLVFALAFGALAFVAGYSTRNYQGIGRDVCWGLMWGGIAGCLGIVAQILMPFIEVYRGY